MATPKTARVISAEWIGTETRLIGLELPEPLGYVGGQYIIVDSGLVLDNGKEAKRAYSILSTDTEQTRLQLAVMRIPGGRCSGALAAGSRACGGVVVVLERWLSSGFDFSRTRASCSRARSISARRCASSFT